MLKTRYLQAVHEAAGVFAYIEIAPGTKRLTRISKARAIKLVTQVPDFVDIDAQWTDDHERLLIGRGRLDA